MLLSIHTIQNLFAEARGFDADKRPCCFLSFLLLLFFSLFPPATCFREHLNCTLEHILGLSVSKLLFLSCLFCRLYFCFLFVFPHLKIQRQGSLLVPVCLFPCSVFVLGVGDFFVTWFLLFALGILWGSSFAIIVTACITRTSYACITSCCTNENRYPLAQNLGFCFPFTKNYPCCAHGCLLALIKGTWIKKPQENLCPEFAQRVVLFKLDTGLKCCSHFFSWVCFPLQEIKQLKDQLQSAQSSVQVEVQCQLADRHQELLLEVTGRFCTSETFLRQRKFRLSLLAV